MTGPQRPRDERPVAERPFDPELRKSRRLRAGPVRRQVLLVDLEVDSETPSDLVSVIMAAIQGVVPGLTTHVLSEAQSLRALKMMES